MSYRLALQFWCLVGVGLAATPRFVVSDGTVVYTSEDGSQKRLDVGKRCLDLWVSPDESVIAFVGIDKTRMPDEAPLFGSKHAMIEQSTIYVATSADHFVPRPVVSRSFDVGGRLWSVLREPSVAPDGETVFFEIPISMTTWRVMSLSLSSGAYRSVGNGTLYCVVWGGWYAGSLLLQERYVRRDLSAGAQAIAYRCHRVGRSGALDTLSDDCSDFGAFVDQWSRVHAASCRVPVE